VFIAGVGGQGLLTIGRILGAAAVEAGHDVTVAEVHGMAQRGGSLNVQVRIGFGEAPLMLRGSADLFIALEALEAARYIEYAGSHTKVVLNKFILPPPLSKYPEFEQVRSAIEKLGVKVYVVNANAISKKVLGTIISANIAILGFAYAVDRDLQKLIEYRHLEKGLETVMKGRALEVNKQVLRLGYEEGLKSAGRVLSSLML